MASKNFFGDLQVTRTAKKHDFPPVFEDTLKLLYDAHKFQCKRLSGEIEFAVFFERLVNLVFLDEAFSKENPQYNVPSSFRRRRRRKGKMAT